jgi:type I restriction enzyme R subunit
VLNAGGTRRPYVVPELRGWGNGPHHVNEHVSFTDGRILVVGRSGRRQPSKQADHVLRYRPDYSIAVVEAKPIHVTSSQCIQQTRDHAEILRLKSAYFTDGHGISEFDYTTSLKRMIDGAPSSGDRWSWPVDNEDIRPKVTERFLPSVLRPLREAPSLLPRNCHQSHCQGERSCVKATLHLQAGFDIRQALPCN